MEDSPGSGYGYYWSVCFNERSQRLVGDKIFRFGRKHKFSEACVPACFSVSDVIPVLDDQPLRGHFVLLDNSLPKNVGPLDCSYTECSLLRFRITHGICF